MEMQLMISSKGISNCSLQQEKIVPYFIKNTSGGFTGLRDFPVGAGVKNQASKAGDTRGIDTIPGSGRSPGGGNGHPLQYSCSENPMDRRTWRATVYGVVKSQTQLTIHIYTMA